MLCCFFGDCTAGFFLVVDLQLVFFLAIRTKVCISTSLLPLTDWILECSGSITMCWCCFSRKMFSF